MQSSRAVQQEAEILHFGLKVTALGDYCFVFFQHMNTLEGLAQAL